MSTVVSKFGGSSTANADCFRRVLAILRASPGRRCAVLSAPGTDGAHGEKVTELLEACWQAREDMDKRDNIINRIVGRYEEIAAPLGIGGFGVEAAREIEVALGISRAHTLSRGEYLCARLFSLYSGFPLVDAAEVIAFDEAGHPDAERTLAKLIGVSRKRDRMVIPGFYGADPAGRIRVFPRNGSDITGALAAAGLGAGLYENWTDVPGLMTADPAIVPDARLIPQVSYRQMRALSRAGAQVLHPDCLDPVALYGIPTRLRCTSRPDSFGTLIDDRVTGVAPCIAGRRDAGDSPSLRFGDVRASEITVFGVDGDKAISAAEGMDALEVKIEEDKVKALVKWEDFEECVRRLHGRLIE